MLNKFLSPTFNPNDLEDPIRDEIYSEKRFKQYAHFLASKLTITTKKKKGRSLLPRVKENEKYLSLSYQKLTNFVTNDHIISPAGEWIIDNYHIVQDQIREIKEDLPERYYRCLPKIVNGELAGYPRVYAIALTLVAHLDSRIDIGTIKSFVTAYQKVTPLLIGEIWAIPIALRIALLENLRRLAKQTVICQDIKMQVDSLVDNLLNTELSSDEKLQSLIEEISKMLGKSHTCDCSTISQISQRLHAKTPEILPVCETIDDYLEGNSLDMEKIVKIEHQLQAATQMSVSNAITSMRLLSNTDWQDFFESLSLVDSILNQDPTGTYKKMEFNSRDHYRDAIERIHKKTGHGEIEIAKDAIRMAQNSFNDNVADKSKHHIGYYLIRKGVTELEEALHYRLTIKEKIKRYILNFPTHFYLGFLVFFIVLLLAPLMLYLQQMSSHMIWPIILFLVALIPASDSSLNILNLFVTYFVDPYTLPKIDLDKGIPETAKTFVVVPTIIGRPSEIPKLLEDLEIRFLANQDKNLFFALLSDFTDAKNEILPSDQNILETLEKGIEQLNDKHSNDNKIFFLFHRKRLWNHKEDKWMGWERKRGKIYEFNKFLKGNSETSFIYAPKDISFFSDIKYVITLDTDTKLPRDTAKKLIGTILHPLNAPQFDEKKKMVIKGFSILQPRISITPESSQKSLFAKIYSGHTGIDPYTTAISDAYQDLFGEGIYTGKGLYVVNTFEASLENRVPENTMLSHDLFEGVFARTALVSDIEFLDDYPTHYDSFAKRQHRWIRGDWQIIKWLFSRIPNEKGKLVTNPLSFISRWKMFDNLRRSLVAPTTLLWFILGWSILPGHPLVWTLIILITITLSFYAHTASQLLKFSKNLSLPTHIKGLYEDLKVNVLQLAISITVLPYQSYLQLDAIVTTLYRVYISKKNLLEWTTAAQVESNLKDGRKFIFKVFKYTSLTSFAILLFIFFIRPYSLITSGLFLLVWVISPLILDWISNPYVRKSSLIAKSDEYIFKNIACRTWNFFESFVNEKNNWLPPDNFQEDPKELIAHRTSPTNMGLYLLSSCSAYNFGYISSIQLIERLEQSLSTMLKLPKQFGHFYNWYDTISLLPLEPEYISTVDSGNLAGHLLAVKQTCLELKESSFKHERSASGLEDILLVMQEEIHKLDKLLINPPTSQSADLMTLTSESHKYCQKLQREDLKDHKNVLEEIKQSLKAIVQKIENLSPEYGAPHYENIVLWLKKAVLKADDLEDEIIQMEDRSFVLKLDKRYDDIANTCEKLLHEMDFSILYDKKRKLFTIGYNVRDGRNDESYYDLLASEARLTSFISISKGDIPEEHWFHLGRQMTSLFHHRVLISWSASMFEYLMPLLVMKDYSGTLLNETHKAVIKQQKAYGNLKSLPWGLSESAYNARDLHMNYQYGPFGVPGMGLKRGLSQDFVISPYSTALAALVNPLDSINNFKKLIKNNFLTKYGFYDAIDYTEGRIPPREDFAIIKNFMAHHQGMTLVALDNVLHNNITQIRFHNDPLVKSSELLLQERIPHRVSTLQTRPKEVIRKKTDLYETHPTLYHIKKVNTKLPEVRVLSNGHYSAMLTASGSGFSKCKNYSIFRWQEDPTLENDGQYFFISDDSNDPINSLTFSPLANNPENYKTTFSDHKVEFWCERNELTIHTEVIVSSGDNVELRRITFTNLSKNDRTFELTSYAEPVLSTADADISHPAFNKLFLETDYIAERSALLARRRKRSEFDQDVHAIHQIVYDKKNCSNLQYETDRAKFLGRKSSWLSAQGLAKGAKLSDSHSSCLDPLFSFKIKVRLRPNETTKILFVSGMTENRDEALRYIDQYNDINIFDREDKMSWTQSQIELRHLNIDIDEVNIYQKVAGALIFSCVNMRPISEIIASNNKSQASLWNYGISGDIPILLVSIKNNHEMNFIQDVLQMHEYLRGRNIQFDLVILSDESSSYRMALYDELLHQIRFSRGSALINKKGGIFLLRKDTITEADFKLLSSVARISIDAHLGSLKKQVLLLLPKTTAPIQDKKHVTTLAKWKDLPIKCPELEFFNGFGGFKNNGKEYQIYLRDKQTTPAPWINVISNSKGFGFLITESGTGNTWSQNSRENKITPWSNDPVLDPSGEIFYLLDNETKQTWCPTPAPIRNDSPYLIRHGQGYTIFEHQSFELSQKLTLYLSLDHEIKIVRLKLKNLSSFKRKISVFPYWEWVLGFHRTKTAHHIISKKEDNIFIVQNPFQLDFDNRITFVGCNKEVSSYTSDRTSFLGRYGNYATPCGLNTKNLDGNMEAGVDPCLAMKIDLDLLPEQEEEVIFVLGQTDKQNFNKNVILEHLTTEKANQVFEQVKNFWDQTLGTVQIQTSHPEFDILINRWILYQTLTCRIWARTAFYQSGGAYGFRDQLQDMTSLLHTKPELAREYILKAAAHQFPEGDVLHWWHPPTDKGVRTRFSDDLLWLPFVTNYYIQCTGDSSILEENISFVEGPVLSEDQDDNYIQTTSSTNKASLYQHCLLALDKSLKLGMHGLPLMGSGDWNDGMSRVGNKGQGESIWLTWFLGTNLNFFIDICHKQGDSEKVQIYQEHLEKLKTSVETTGWDGQWYRRAYFDDGSPLGSKENEECKIASIAQSWSVLSNLGEKEHRKQAMMSAKKYLIDSQNRLVRLFTPPFNKILQDPGYIKGYPPGVRENGGQYTHAAIWLAMAFAQEGDGDTAFEIMELINPIKHSFTKAKAQKYMTEPYVISADVYSHPEHMGKGGWSWYTGSSGWFYKCFIESILGINRYNEKLVINPSLPESMHEYHVQYKYKQTTYKIHVKKSDKSQLYIDGVLIGTEITIPLIDDQREHTIEAFIHLA